MLQDRLIAAKVLAEASEARGYAVQLQGDVCRFPNAGLDAVVQEVVHAEQNEEIVSCLISGGRPHSSFAPVPVVCTGAAPALPRAAREAAEQWLDLVFPVLHSVFADHQPTLGVEIGKLTSVLRATGRTFEWRVHIGPIFTRFFGDGAAVPESDPTELVRHIVNALAGVSAHTNGFAADLYAARNTDGTTATDCRIDNNPWQEATDALLAAPASWPPTNVAILTKRQLLFFQPAATASSQAESTSPKSSFWLRAFRKDSAGGA